MSDGCCRSSRCLALVPDQMVGLGSVRNAGHNISTSLDIYLPTRDIVTGPWTSLQPPLV
jgi:hypothetical protein